MEVLINSKDIEIQTKIVAKKINDEHRGDITPIVFIGLLKGCFMFYSDFIKNLDFPLECDFMRVKSYAGKKQGDVQILKDIEIPIKGKHVYIIDDILDTGNTLKYVIKYLESKSPHKVSIITLIKRENSPIFKIPSHHIFTIHDEWICGYGLDDEKGYYRNIPHILKI
jgi:hypoxanthine phosphoribosyltransferase